MKNILLFAIMLAIVPATSVVASDPPAHGSYNAGWGMNPGNWDATTGGWSSGLSLYSGSGGGQGWYNNWTNPGTPTWDPDYAPISLELWIELYMIQTYEYTSYQWHRLGNAGETIEFIISGTIRSNSGEWIILERGTDPMTHLWFQHNVLGGTSLGLPHGWGGHAGGHVPITWYYCWGRGLTWYQNIQVDWTEVDPGDGNIEFAIEEGCDHWYGFKGELEILYHQPDGYYTLEIAGCPSPLL